MNSTRLQTPCALTVIVPTGNRAGIIEDCLRSVRWADEVIVVDSYSTDGTLDIARRYADKVLQHAYGFSASQKNWAIPQARHAWVLIVDTDERVTRALQQEIRAVLATPESYVGYRIPRANYFLDQQIGHGGYAPDYQVRLFRRDAGRYALRQVHAHMQLDGPCGTLANPLVHYAHRSVDQMLEGLLRQMTRWEAQQRLAEAQGRGLPSLRRQVVNLVLRPVAAFGLRYLWQGAWRDGVRGLVLSLVWAMYVCLTYIRIWEAGLAVPPDWWVKHWQGYESAQGAAITGTEVTGE